MIVAVISAACAVIGNVSHKSLIDLQLVDREVGQVGERGVSGAEIVDRKSHADRFQRTELSDGLATLLHQGAFGDLQLDVVRRQAGLAKDGANSLIDARNSEAARRHVDGHGFDGQPRAEPCLHLPARSRGIPIHPSG